MGDDPIVISSGLVITPESVMSRSFTAAFRGYHPAEVRQFLKRVSDEMAASAGREVELRRALQEALARAAHPDLDEATVTKVLGDHAARLIATARDTASSITAEAHKQAEALMRDAENRAARIRDEADGLLARRVAEADAATAGVQQSADAQAEALRRDARAEAEAIVEAARAEGRAMVTEARALRERMLGDLARRRRAAQLQVEQLHAARDRLLAAYDVVRRTLDQATAELAAAEPEARMAAEAVARRSEESHVAVPAPPDSGPSPPGSQRSLALVTDQAQPGGREREPRVERVVASGGGSPPSTTELRRGEERSPAAAPDRPPMRPQTVADVAARQPASRAVTAAPPDRQPAPAPQAAAPPPPAAPPAPVAPPPPAAPPAPTPAPPVPTKVEELFSRLRAERLQARMAEAGPDPVAAMDSPDAEASPPSHAPPPAAPVDVPPPSPVETETALEGRDSVLDKVEAGLTRVLKRVLQNEQNAILDGLRRMGPSESVLPDQAAHAASYRDAALPWLEQAGRAGVGDASETAYPPVEPHAQALAEELVGPLRERLSRTLAETAGGEDPTVTAEGLRAVYRQWKTQQVKECARHYTVTAFSVAAFAATPADTALQWVVDDDGPCPDCDDNALAGPTPKGRPYPTGQPHPPAHRGCRCLLVPATS